MALNFTDKINEASKNIKSLEEMSGTGLLQPFNNLNAGVN